MSIVDLTYADFARWYDRWHLLEVIKSPHGIPTHISEKDFHLAMIEITTVMWSEHDNSKYSPYSTADPRSVAANTALFIDISRDNRQWQRQWIRFAVNEYEKKILTH